jgi:hypothetical protein
LARNFPTSNCLGEFQYSLFYVSMKKSFWVLLITSVLLIGAAIAIFIAYNFISDPGGNKKYDIDVDHFMQNNLSLTDSTGFREGLTPTIMQEIKFRGERHEYLYDPRTGRRIGKVKDTIIDMFFTSKLVNNDNSRTLVFATFLKALYYYDLENGDKPYLQQYSVFSSGVLFEKYSVIKRITCFGEGEYIYDDTILHRNNADAAFSSKTNIQHILVDYKYYGSFPVFKNENEEFWEMLEE